MVYNTTLPPSLHPNPANDHIQLILPFPEDGTKAQIRSMNGAVQQKLSLTNRKQRIDITSLPKGIYMVEIQNHLGTSTQRFVKM